jgi:hypothetical protein
MKLIRYDTAVYNVRYNMISELECSISITRQDDEALFVARCDEQGYTVQAREIEIYWDLILKTPADVWVRGPRQSADGKRFNKRRYSYRFSDFDHRNLPTDLVEMVDEISGRGAPVCHIYSYQPTPPEEAHMQIIYHAGTGTYFELDDDVMFIHTGDLPEDMVNDLREGHEPDLTGQGFPLKDILAPVWVAN